MRALAAPSGSAHQEQFAAIRVDVERRLAVLAPPARGQSGRRLRKAIRYSLLSGGKRLRPLAVVLTASALGGRAADALDPACAVEMVHTASLMLDDLPSMDDAARRRGKLANHIKHGEDIAILGAVSLLSEAFGVLASARNIPPQVRLRLVDALSRAIGADGLSAGQERDLREASAMEDDQALEQLHRQKTGALFLASLEMGARIAGLDSQRLEPFRAFGVQLGLAFQMLDDLLDRIGSAEATGKDSGQDLRRPSFASILSREEAERRAFARLETALETLRPAVADPGPFLAFIDLVRCSYLELAGSGSARNRPARAK